jgi:starvation-inducible DNA-binding protein
MKTKMLEKSNLVVVKADAHSPIISHLNYVLAQCIDLKLQAKQAHWNVKGENFMTMHLLFDQIATDVNEYADMLAERVMQLDGMAQGTVQMVEKDSCLPAYPTHVKDAQKHATALSAAMHIVCQKLHDLIDKSTQDNDAVTADICTEIARGLDKSIWFVRSHFPEKN